MSRQQLLPAETAPLVLVLGLTGAIGRAIAAALARRGYRIRALARNVEEKKRIAYPHAVEWIDGDALDRKAVLAAAEGAALIVHGVNPPGYTKWREAAIPMLRNTIDAGARAGATILFPANVYVFNDRSAALVGETAPMAPTTRKGQVRLEMEAMLAEAAETRGLRVIAVRAGDFFGPGVSGSWFAGAVAKGGRAANVVHTLSRPGVGHSWAYVPDLAETFARLADIRATLAPFEMVHFGGHYDASGRDMALAAQAAIGTERVTMKRFAWIAVYLGAPFVPFLREVIEMLWLWRHPLRLDNAKLVRLIGPEPHTPLADAVSAALGPMRPSGPESLGAPVLL